ncbi:MAG: protoheme IX farnesyltransferase [Bdellovibrio sp. CG10_big_fil_rev_8_21_14_0_10_47_8]|nr:MAG: protoheme IX farnesyltransferase [Bdellovibrio sp. CG10_big_fil_rev_8_21_14_0_10_47_8]
MFRIYADLTKFGIVIFVVLAGLAGYATSYEVEKVFDWHHFLSLLGGLFFLSSGSLSLNQIQELKIDRKMPRTAKRPVASGKIQPAAAAILSITFLFIGSNLLFKTAEMAGLLGWLTVILYNGVYTYWWKPKWIFAAIPGAIPGALPVSIGYVANGASFFNLDSIYLFSILFLWQMPHFWALAIRFKDDYAKGGVPTLPAALGIHKTLFHMGLWTFLYVFVAVASPWFIHVSWVYILGVFPVTFKILQEFWRFYRSDGRERWLAFFMWVNVSVLIFLYIPVLDKWSFLFLPRV